MDDIAGKAGVSRKSVYGILNNRPGIRVSEKTREKVLAVAREMNYAPNHFARSLKTGRTNTIGITSGTGTPVRQLFNDSYLSELYAGIGDTAAEHGYRMMFQQSNKEMSADDSMEMALGRMVDGVIFVLLSQQLAEFKKLQLPRLKKLGVPFAVAMTYVESIDAPTAAMDAEHGAYTCTRHLADQEYRDIGFLHYGGIENPFNTAQLDGFRNALVEAGIDPAGAPLLQSENMDARGGVECMARFLDEGNSLPRAWYCTQPRNAEGAMAALAGRGLNVPDDCAFTSYGVELKDADALSSLSVAPAPVRELGQSAGELLFDRMAGVDPENTILKPELICRTSCGCNGTK